MEIVIIGCTHAGTAAAQAILATHPEHHVTVIERHEDISFLACGIALYLDQTVPDLAALHVQTPADLAQAGATLLMQHEVVAVDVAAKQVTARDLKQGAPVTLCYDKLIIATGAKHELPPALGAAAKRVLLCKDQAEAEAVADSAQTATKIALIGGG